MTQKQQVFWVVVGGVIAAVLGAVISNWLSKPAGVSASEITYKVARRDLPTELCTRFRKNQYVDPDCSVILIDIKNPSSEEVGSFSVRIDFKDALYTPVDDKSIITLEGSGEFLSTDFNMSSTTNYQRKIDVQRLPRFATLKFTAIVASSSSGDVHVIGDNRVHLKDLSENSSDDWNKFALAVFLGFLILPIIALIASFFGWLAKESSSKSANAETEAAKTDA